MKNLDTHSGHTAGPWIIRDRTGTIGNPSLGIEGPGCEVIASVIYQNGFDALQSNARLIAAAPELLEACKAAEFAIRREKELQSERGESVAVDLGFAHSKILAAITKAEGNA